MAKKKKQTRRKKVEEQEPRSAFWPLSGAVLMIIAAVFLLLGGLETGGPLPKGLFDAAYWTLGMAAYLTPVALTYYGVHKFTSEDYQIPFAKFMSMLTLLVFTASWLHVGFIDTNQLTGERISGYGGKAGSLIGNLVLTMLDATPAALLFFVLAVLMFLLSFGISPRIFLKLFDLFKRPETDDTDLGELKSRAADNGFKLNEGVPVERSSMAAERMVASREASQRNAEKQRALTIASDPDWNFPSIELLDKRVDKANAGDVEGSAALIKETYANFGIEVEMEGATVGPTVTQYTMKPPANVKLTKITALEHNLALTLAAHSLRMEAPIPGKKAVGIEVPNAKPAIVRISSLLQSNEWGKSGSPLSFAVGKDINGTPIIADLADMPHVLIAGQTKSGKSVMINTMLTSLIYRNAPSDLKMILVDPKVVELAPYNDIPHLLAPVISEPEKCVSALKWAVAEMERRYKALAEAKKRNIEEYNSLKKEEGMPYIVIIIDELADLMMMAARDVEALIVRIAQKARAVGIHLVLATQSPRADVITGLIKANVPARIAFAVAGQIESRIILDSTGAEKLLGKGDMLFQTTDMPRPKRVQGAFISTEETQKVTEFLREQREPQYDDEILSQPVQLNGKGGVVAEVDSADEGIYKEAVAVVIQAGKASTSLLQRKLRIGYGKAARLIETMEEQGIVSHADGSRPREVLVGSIDEVFGGATGDVYDDMPDDSKDEFLAR